MTTALPVIALVGRPNVGKSTLFNALTRTRDALVADVPGLTRDRQYGVGQTGDIDYVVVDTGGLSGNQLGIEGLMERQVQLAIEESDAVLFVVDARDQLMVDDDVIAKQLRKIGKPVFLVVNKIDGQNLDTVAIDFYQLGLGEPSLIAASHRRGVAALIGRVAEELGDDLDEPPAVVASGIRVAMVGRPNVGKSTLINRFLGEERVVAYDQPGTTRDTIMVPFEKDGTAYTLIDTAGVRRKAKVREAIEKFSIIKALQAIEATHVVILLVDAHEGILDQDIRLLGHVIDSGRALVIAVNKWDGLSKEARAKVKEDIERKLRFIRYASIEFVSALHGTGVGNLLTQVDKAYAASMSDLATSKLTEVLEMAVQYNAPPMVRGRRVKLRYAHQGGKNPPIIVIHGNQTDALSQTYRRYLENFFRDVFKLKGSPIRLEFKNSTNPYRGRRNKLTPRQERKRKRLMERVKR